MNMAIKFSMQLGQYPISVDFRKEAASHGGIL